MNCFGVTLLLPVALILSPASSFARDLPKELTQVGITEHLGEKISIRALQFMDENGKAVHLSDYFASGKPVLLTLIYYECPNLCNMVLNGVVKSLRGLNWTPGKDFQIIAVSINPREKPDLARHKRDAYIESYGRPESVSGWHFLTGSEDQIRKLAEEVGYGYQPDGNEFAHAAAIYALTSEGKISRYLYGTEYPERTLRLALLEASNGRIGTVIDRVLLFCYHYDPKTGKYSVYLTRLMQGGCTGTAIFFGAYLAMFWRKERRPISDPISEKKGA